MTYSDVHNQIQRIINRKMKVRHKESSYTANFSDDFKMAEWEVTLLMNLVEDQFNIRLETGTERNLFSMNQLVALVYKESQKAFSHN